MRLSTSTDRLRLRTKKGLQGGKTIQQRSKFFASLVPNASTSSLAHALVRSLHTCMCVYYSESTQLSVVDTLLLLLRSWDPWLRRTSRPQCGYILTSLNRRTNRIGDLTRHRVSWGSPLMVPLRVHMMGWQKKKSKACVASLPSLGHSQQPQSSTFLPSPFWPQLSSPNNASWQE